MPLNKYCFIAFLLTIFREFSKFGVLFTLNVLEKFLKIPKRFSETFQNRKDYQILPKLVQNPNIDQNQAKFSLSTVKTAIFSFKSVLFQNFRRPRSQKFGV